MERKYVVGCVLLLSPFSSFNYKLSLQAVRDAISAGVDGYDADVKKAVRKAAHGLRLTREVAMSIASKAVSIHSFLSQYFFSLVNFSFN